jgi:(1->4)-alpha-D-glucan 1-alpha-D-glucosylmutase
MFPEALSETDQVSRAPASTYRLQLHPGFGFRHAREIVAYLDALGISHAYASPYLKSQHGSTHGYDLVDPSQINPELGGDEAFGAWVDALRSRGMGHIVDFVPNHMGIGTGENAWWQDVLENGESSTFAGRFDIEWSPPKRGLEGRVLLPILGAQYGRTLEKGELAVVREGGAFFVHFYDRRLPVSPPTLVPVIQKAITALDLPADEADAQELASIVSALGHLPSSRESAPDRRAERAREKEVVKRRLAKLCEDSPRIAAAIDGVLANMRGEPGVATSFDALDQLLRDQCYRLAFWRVATEEINYRRFFDVNTLAAIRMETDDVFEAAHALVFRLIDEGRLDGLRLDHVDGLYDPAAYLERLARSPRASGNGMPYVVVEKILGTDERLPASWAVDGTTGYDYLARASGLFVDPASETELTSLYQECTGDRATFPEHARRSKLLTLSGSLSSEIHMLAQSLERIASANRRSRDFTLAALTAAIAGTIASFAVYRTYVRPDGSREPTDEENIARAVRAAKRADPERDPSVFDFLRDVVALRLPDDASDDERREWVHFAMRFQQVTGPVMAKGVEDGAFYSYTRLAQLNEVGGQPDRFGTSIAEYHALNTARARDWPLGMIATSTHDTKRSEDVRAKLAVLTEIPELWRRKVLGWREHARAFRRPVDDADAPEPTDEYLFYQTAFGVLPFGGAPAFSPDVIDRVAAYMEKAAREAKQRTTWLTPNEPYESALRDFTRRMLEGPFARSVCDLSALLSTFGASNALAQVVLKIASPGVADTYQGSETFLMSLVDPDNRRPVDYATLQSRLARLRHPDGDRRRFAEGLLARYADGDIKLYLVHRALTLRRRHQAVFAGGAYRPVEGGQNVVAFARESSGRTIACAAVRHPFRLTRGEASWAIGPAWGEGSLALPPGRYRDYFTGAPLEAKSGARLAEVFRSLPVALLVREEAGSDVEMES